MNDRLKGLTAVVTGGASGIGRETALQLAGQGANVVVTDVSPRAEGTLPGVGFVAVDNRDTAAIAVAVAKLEASAGPVGILVNNAGLSGRSLPLSDIGEDEFDAMFATHVRGAFFFARAVVPGMRQKKFGRIINISSYFVLVGSASASHYVGAKAALHGLTRAWAQEFAADGITVNAVAPGLIDTPMTQRSVGKDVLAERGRRYPMGRLPRAEEIAATVAWLAGPDTAAITGQVISPNGGIATVGM